MSRNRQIGLMVVAAVLATGMLHALRPSGRRPPEQNLLEQSPQPVRRVKRRTASARTTDDVVPETTVTTPQTVYVPALDGTGLIALDHSIRTRLLYGANYSGGLDSNPGGPGESTDLRAPS